jgi:mono/diheme cytochrome c family protein
LLDENRMELRRMRSFISFQPGEMRSCSGCHESRNIAPLSQRPALAAQRLPSLPEPPPWGDRAISFLRDVQPVFDRNCVRCHSGLQPKGGLDFSGGLTSHDPAIAGYGYNRAFETMLQHDLISISQVRAQDASITPALAYGSRRSKLVAALNRKPHAEEVNLSDEDRRRLIMWIDANAPYHDRFVNKRSEISAYDLASDQALARRIASIQERRCVECHKVEAISRLDWIRLDDPPSSLFLSAPLAREAGGTLKCPQATYATVDDPSYQQLRLWVQEAVTKAWKYPRRDLQSMVEARESRKETEQAAITKPRNH